MKTVQPEVSHVTSPAKENLVTYLHAWHSQFVFHFVIMWFDSKCRFKILLFFWGNLNMRKVLLESLLLTRACAHTSTWYQSEPQTCPLISALITSPLKLCFKLEHYLKGRRRGAADQMKTGVSSWRPAEDMDFLRWGSKRCKWCTNDFCVLNSVFINGNKKRVLNEWPCRNFIYIYIYSFSRLLRHVPEISFCRCDGKFLIPIIHKKDAWSRSNLCCQSLNQNTQEFMALGLNLTLGQLRSNG